MSYQEKRAMVSVCTGVLLLAAYGIWALGKVRAGMAAPDDWKYWAGAMLVFIGIGVAATIVIQIVLHILLSIGIAVKKQIRTGKVDDGEVEKEIKQEMVEDEMDKLIGLKSMRASFSVAGFGFVAALAALALGFAPAVMLNILFVAFFLGSICEGILQMYYYKRGIAHGR